jgi:hypothetical protein
MLNAKPVMGASAFLLIAGLLFLQFEEYEYSEAEEEKTTVTGESDMSHLVKADASVRSSTSGVPSVSLQPAITPTHAFQRPITPSLLNIPSSQKSVWQLQNNDKRKSCADPKTIDPIMLYLTGHLRSFKFQTAPDLQSMFCSLQANVNFLSVLVTREMDMMLSDGDKSGHKPSLTSVTLDRMANFFTGCSSFTGTKHTIISGRFSNYCVHHHFLFGLQQKSYRMTTLVINCHLI